MLNPVACITAVWQFFCEGATMAEKPGWTSLPFSMRAGLQDHDAVWGTCCKNMLQWERRWRLGRDQSVAQTDCPEHNNVLRAVSDIKGHVLTKVFSEPRHHRRVTLAFATKT